jgi:hypothetical protein
MKFILRVCLSFASAINAIAQVPSMPMKENYEDSAESAWTKKKVLDTRVLDAMTNPATWTFKGRGKVSTVRPSGTPLLRIDVGVHDPLITPGWGPPAVSLTKTFPKAEDWTRFNRVSFRIRARLKGFYNATLVVSLRNDGKVKVPDVYQREGSHYLTLSNDRWTDINWEIEPLGRDKVTTFDIRYWMNKPIPAEGDSVTLEIGRVELQRVVPDHYEGWNVAPGKIVFSHTGYIAGAAKTAIATGLSAREFSVIRPDTGQTVLRKPLLTTKNHYGEFQELDFSELRQPGSYALQAGTIRSRPFRIDDDVWTGTIWKTINFFYGERCGMAIPGIHDACHRDWQATLGDKKIVMNGGWHDAGDLSQGLVNTGEAVYAMFSLARRMQARGENPELV